MVTMVELEEERGPAIRALGTRLKLTEVFIWDDGSKQTYDKSFSTGKSRQTISGGDDGSNNVESECGTLPEDLELTRQMNALGLPVSFQTNKEKRDRKTGGRRKGMRLKHSDTLQEVVVEALEESSRVNAGEVVPRVIFDGNAGSSLCCMSMMGETSSNVAAGTVEFQCHSIEGDNPESSNEFTSGAVVNNTMKIVASGTGLDDELCPRSCPTDDAVSHDKMELGEKIMVHDHLECSLMGSHEAELTDTCEDYVIPEQPCVSESVSYSMCSEVLDQDGTESQDNGDFGDWMVYWDSYYMRNYFYNTITHTSTWFPPPGMEHIATVDTTYKSDEVTSEVMVMDVTTGLNGTDFCGLSKTDSFEESVNDDATQDQPCRELSEGLELSIEISVSDATLPTVSESRCPEYPVELNESNTTQDQPCTEEISEDSNMHSVTGVSSTNDLEMQSDPAVVKRKKRVRRTQIQRKLSNENEELVFQGLLKECSADIGKYWCQRYLLFSRYDDGIKMDEEGWFSVTPEPLARHHAERCGSGIIIDCFTGVGGNSIQFAQISEHITAIDIDSTKIDYAHHNAVIYGVDDKIDFIKGDFFLLAPNLKADTVFLSPPWGGPDYAKVKTYDLKTMLKPHDGYFLFNTAKEVASTIVMFLPRNVDINQLAELALSGSRPWSLEVEKNFLNGKLKGITAYFSETAVRQ